MFQPSPKQPFSWEDERLVSDMYRAVFGAVAQHCRRLLDADQSAADDVAQEAFVRVLAHRPSLPTFEDFRRYLFRSAANLCFNQIRHRRVADHFEASERRGGDRLAAATLGDSIVVSVLGVSDELARISPRDRRIVLWHAFGASQTEIAAYAGVTRRTVYSRLRLLEDVLRSA
jgi:RNA polymerase sigma-70 factor (ECF subfamily)